MMTIVTLCQSGQTYWIYHVIQKIIYLHGTEYQMKVKKEFEQNVIEFIEFVECTSEILTIQDITYSMKDVLLLDDLILVTTDS